MNLPIELYVLFYIETNCLKVTKSLRSVSKSALIASDYYHRLLLKKPVSLYFSIQGSNWLVLMNDGMDKEVLINYYRDLWRKELARGILALGGNHWNEFTAFRMGVGDLFLATNQSGKSSSSSDSKSESHEPTQSSSKVFIL